MSIHVHRAGDALATRERRRKDAYASSYPAAIATSLRTRPPEPSGSNCGGCGLDRQSFPTRKSFKAHRALCEQEKP